MIYNFNTLDESAATAAFVIYAVYRSRDIKKFKITPDMWAMIERACKSVSKRTDDLGEFIEKLKPKLMCASIKPKWAKTTPDGMITLHRLKSGELVEMQQNERRQFLTDLLREADNKAVLETIYKKTAYVILLVRDRLERERPYELQTAGIEFIDEVDEVVENV